jgi:iron(III) ABC superfamily ATP binding cassette transporter, membrane protein
MRRILTAPPVLAAVLAIIALYAVSAGSVAVPTSDTLAVVTAKLMGHEPFIDPAVTDIIWELRVPRVLLAMAAGAGLALAGVVMQASVQNPLAEPFILGIASGASVGATLAILLGSAAIPFGVPGAAFLGAILATLAVLMLAGIHRRVSTVKLVLAGAAISALCVAATNFIVYMAADAEGMQSAAFWTMGSLADAKWRSLFLPVLVVSALAVYFLSQLRTLDVLLLGEELATTLGIDASAKRRRYMALLALLTGVLVATCGIIGFVGLVVPHLVRAFTGASHRRLLPAALLIGAIFLIVADLIARTLLPSGDLPIGIITALIGAPLFMKLLFGSGGNFGG